MLLSRRVLPVLAATALCAVPLASAAAQSCLGYPAKATGQLSGTVGATIGSDFWGLGADLNGDFGGSGLFGIASVGTIKFVTEPIERRVDFGGTLGYERYNRDQLIWCPFVSASGVRGDEVEGTAGPQRTSGRVLSVGLGVGFEIERRGPMSFNPYLSVRQSSVKSRIDRSTAADTESTESGAVFAFGIGFRFREAIQITPSFSGATFSGSNLIFDLRASVALQFR
jgi:hypothetical protein